MGERKIETPAITFFKPNTRATAKKAKLLSSKNLNKMAKKHNLSDPTTKQIILIPESK